MMDNNFILNIDDYIKSKRYRLINAVLVDVGGELVLERYYNGRSRRSRNQIKSVWKSIMSLLLGICLDKGFISFLDEPICRYLPQFAANSQPYHEHITVRHLLTMSSGIYWNGGVHYHCPMMDQLRRSRDWLGHIADVRMAAYPGTQFVYKEWDVILLSAVIGRACGSAYDACREYLYGPLGITSERWTRSACGVDYPSYGDDATDGLSAYDLIKIGRMMQNGGVYDGRRIVSEKYIKTAVSPSEADGGYGFMFWLSDAGYHARGFGGQELNIYPDKKTAAVIQATVTPSSKSYGDICYMLLNEIFNIVSLYFNYTDIRDLFLSGLPDAAH